MHHVTACLYEIVVRINCKYGQFLEITELFPYLALELSISNGLALLALSCTSSWNLMILPEGACLAAIELEYSLV